MKKLLVFSLSVLFSATFMRVSAQEGRALFEVTDVKSDNPQAAQQLTGATILVQTHNGVVKSVSSMMNNAVQMQRVTNLQNQGSALYLDLMGKKIYVSVADSIQRARLKVREENTNISYDPAVTKVINGYTCHKAVVETLREDGSVREYDLFVTEEIKLPNFAISGLPASLRGFPLEYVMKTGSTEVVYTLKELTDTVASDFQETPAGYPEMPFAEFEAGLGKKLGF
ncbi:MAG TPA: hypothetical protein PLO67_00400 [Saprospiraceae bacterium]|nr:hypothetical protein [Saprospiraceae bacterium]HPI06025.1 hypothetical protein [Saprospiraceae bacterium]